MEDPPGDTRGDRPPVVQEARTEKKKRSTLLTVCPFILGTELCERMAFYGISTNLVNYLRRLGASNADGTIITNVFNGMCYTTPVLGGYLADSFMGRYWTILMFAIIYGVGMVLLSVTAGVRGLHPDDDEHANTLQWTLLGLALSVVTIGTGGMKPNISAFGADQFDEKDPQDAKEKDSFFNFFYFFINVGALIASLVIVYIQDNISWSIGFLIPGVAMVVAIAVYLAGTPFYKRLPPGGSAFVRFARISWSEFTKLFASKKPESVELVESGVFTDEQIYETKLVWSIIPVFLTNILYWTVYNQMYNTFVLQGGLMNRNINVFGRWDIDFPSASLSTFDTAIIILLVPIYDRGLIPLLRFFKYEMTHLRRMGWGYILAIFAMLSAAGVEYWRLDLFHKGKVLDEKEHDSVVVDLSIWWMIIPYCFIGASEVFASIAQLEFFYAQAPDSMRSMMMALNLVANALGGYLAGVLVPILNSLSTLGGQKWMADDLNEGRMDLFYVVIGGLMAFNTIIFLLISFNFKYKDPSYSRAKAQGKQDDLIEHEAIEGQEGAPLL